MTLDALARSFWDAVARQDRAALRGFFAPSATVRWHCTNECFTVEGYIRANCDYPGAWQGEVERVEPLPCGMLTAARVWTEGASFHSVSLFRLNREGLITELDEYWGDDGEPPAWRRAMGLSTRIK